MTTPQEHIYEIRNVCAQLEAEPNIREAVCDDWGRFSNFQLLVYPKVYDRFFTVRLKALLKKRLPKGAHIRQVFPPARGDQRSRSSYWLVDVDFNTYDSASNMFV